MTSGPIAPQALMKHVEYLADPGLEGRAAASEGEREAARYVANRLRAMGLAPVQQSVPYSTGSTNVYAMLEGSSDEVIVIGAHLDHLGRVGGVLHPGANDNASGVALVL